MRNSRLFVVTLILLFASQVASAFPFGAGVLGTDIFGDGDQDLVSDTQEAIDGTNPLVADTDGDGLLDGLEASYGTNPLISDTDSDGIADNADTDDDGDGYSDSEETDYDTDPLDADSSPIIRGLNWGLIKTVLDQQNQSAD